LPVFTGWQTLEEAIRGEVKCSGRGRIRDYEFGLHLAVSFMLPDKKLCPQSPALPTHGAQSGLGQKPLRPPRDRRVDSSAGEAVWPFALAKALDLPNVAVPGTMQYARLVIDSRRLIVSSLAVG
jgi:hypothetical protein